jgi:hypothetical protein
MDMKLIFYIYLSNVKKALEDENYGIIERFLASLFTLAAICPYFMVFYIIGRSSFKFYFYKDMNPTYFLAPYLLFYIIFFAMLMRKKTARKAITLYENKERYNSRKYLFLVLGLMFFGIILLGAIALILIIRPHVSR